MWLPKALYESIPFSWLVAGVVALGAGFFIEAGYWGEIVAGCGAIALVIGLMLLLRRKGYRSSRSRLDFDRSN